LTYDFLFAFPFCAKKYPLIYIFYLKLPKNTIQSTKAFHIFSYDFQAVCSKKEKPPAVFTAGDHTIKPYD